MALTPTDVLYFESPAEFRAWLDANGKTADSVWVGYYKKSRGKLSISHADAIDEALCYGWIDSIRKGVDDERYANRFTPRRPGSNWSQINIDRVGELAAQGRMLPPGLRAFEQRGKARATVSSADVRHQRFDEASEQRFRANEAAWAFFQAQPPGYRRTVIHWVTSAKREETRLKRLETLIEDSANGRRIGLLGRPAKNA